MKINVHAGHTRQNGNAPWASGIVHKSDRRIKGEVIKGYCSPCTLVSQIYSAKLMKFWSKRKER